MSSPIFKNVLLAVGGYDLSGFANALGNQNSRDMIDASALADTTKRFDPGLKFGDYSLEGVMDGALDKQFYDALDLNYQPILIGLDAGADGKTCVHGEGIQSDFAVTMEHGQNRKFSVKGSTKRFFAGTILGNSAQTSTGSGTGRQLGAVASGYVVRASAHILAASGASPTLDLVVDSDDNAGFTSPVQRIAFSQFTAVGSQWRELAGQIADDYWKISFTIGGGSPSFLIVVALSIKPE